MDDIPELTVAEVAARLGEPSFHVFDNNGQGRWKLEDRKPDGTWSDVTCQADCVLRESGPADLRRLFTPADLASITPNCVHNTAFAFCTYTLKAGLTAPDYLLVLLVTDKPVSVRLRRLKGNA